MNIYIWGTGCGAAELIEKKIPQDYIKAFVDNQSVSSTFLGKPVMKPKELPIEEVDLLIITSSHTQEILNQCLSLGLSRETLFFTKNHYTLTDLNSNCIVEKDFLQDLQEPCRIIREPKLQRESILENKDLEQDFVRVKTLELLTDSLKDISGAVAELGVYQGRFARIINLLFPERKLYLFDTFEGFNLAEAKQELLQQTCDSFFVDAHENTSITTVLRRMPHPEQIIIKQGIFPESVGYLDENFVFVSLDVDFEESTYAGLCWFWPRLSDGGYIFLHDYNSKTLTGVKRAVKRYEEDYQIRLVKLPLCDINGTLVLCKT